MSVKHVQLLSLAIGLFSAGAVWAQTTYSDNFSGVSSTLKWLPLNDACLTAGDGSGSIPACNTSTAPKDAAGSGALRLTPAKQNQTGAILSNFTFPNSQGMQVTFTTYTYGGSNDGPASDGADGISFMLTDGAATAPTVAGGLGGSMGYSCSNSNGTYEGMANAYLGLGIDEWGNFLNSGDNTSSGIASVNSWGTGQYQPQRIGLRGAGNTTWAWLKSQNSNYYSGNVDQTKTEAACKSGKYYARTSGSNVLTTMPYNYNAIAGGWAVLPSTTLIANEGTSTRLGNTTNPTDYTKNAWPITYKLQLSPSGLLNFSYSYNNGVFQPVLVNSQITTFNGPLPGSFRFGFSAGTGGSHNIHEITCFQASPLQSNSSAAANTVQSGEVKTGTQVYLAAYSSDTWWGSLAANQLVAVGGVLAVSTTADWDAKCVLTGGPCDSMGTDASGKPTKNIPVEKPDDRTLLTWNGDATTPVGIPLVYDSLSGNQKTILQSTDSLGSKRVSWLRGDRTVEQLRSPPGLLRARTIVMGDIIDSSPTWVGAPSAGVYPNAFSDGLYGNPSNEPENASGAPTYSSFASANATRLSVVYVGGNDGYMHAFRSGSFTAAGVFDPTNNDGKEILGFIPGGVLANKAVALTNPSYVHDYLVDATPAAGDVFYGNAWHTWLVGGVGATGAEIFALDITDPSTFAESKASSLVKGDWTDATLGNLGNTVGTPIITRMHNGQWAIIFGNGLGSGKSAGVYIGLIDKTSGAVTFRPFLDTKVGSASIKNGISYVTSVDLDSDHIADYLYGGDQQGNVWRFDVTSNDPTKWAVKLTPLYVAKDGSGNLQPITTAVTVASVLTGTDSRDMVFFGTGQKTPFDSAHGDQYATGKQTFYGIWDWDLAAWNALSKSVNYATLTGAQTVTRAKLLAQTSSESAATTGGTVLGYRTLGTSSVVCWQGSTICSAGNTQYGWLFDLPSSQEQIIYNPVIIGGAVVVSTAIPPAISALQCNPGLQSGWTMAFNPATGGGLTEGFFPGADGGFGAGSDGSTVSGIRLDGVGSPTTVTYNGQTYLVTQTVKGAAALSKVNPPSGDDPNRVSWREIRNQ